MLLQLELEFGNNTNIWNSVLNQGSQGGSAALQSGSEAPTTTGQEAERIGAGGDNMPSGSNVSGASIPGDSQTLRRLSSATWPGSPTGPSLAITAFEAAKDIMEALRTKHTNLANELEVSFLLAGCFVSW